MSGAFLKATRLVMLAALPFYFGLAATAEPLIPTLLGPKWAETIAIVPLLTLAMPFLTLQIFFAPATNVPGTPGIAVRTGAAGAALLTLPFLLGIPFGLGGRPHAWPGGIIPLP